MVKIKRVRLRTNSESVSSAQWKDRYQSLASVVQNMKCVIADKDTVIGNLEDKLSRKLVHIENLEQCSDYSYWKDMLKAANIRLATMEGYIKTLRTKVTCLQEDNDRLYESYKRA